MRVSLQVAPKFFSLPRTQPRNVTITNGFQTAPTIQPPPATIQHTLARSCPALPLPRCTNPTSQLHDHQAANPPTALPPVLSPSFASCVANHQNFNRRTPIPPSRLPPSLSFHLHLHRSPGLSPRRRPHNRQTAAAAQSPAVIHQSHLHHRRQHRETQRGPKAGGETRQR